VDKLLLLIVDLSFRIGIRSRQAIVRHFLWSMRPERRMDRALAETYNDLRDRIGVWDLSGMSTQIGSASFNVD